MAVQLISSPVHQAGDVYASCGGSTALLHCSHPCHQYGCAHTMDATATAAQLMLMHTLILLAELNLACHLTALRTKT
jgi:hypothetical protein